MGHKRDHILSHSLFTICKMGILFAGEWQRCRGRWRLSGSQSGTTFISVIYVVGFPKPDTFDINSYNMHDMVLQKHEQIRKSMNNFEQTVLMSFL